MHLERLEIQGFKSFAGKTVFEFPASSNNKPSKSITAIVGPNGSGKSNVSDAVRWVLGEQSLKLIRAKKADDVIFGGSEKKARQGCAEVCLFMNNEDKELPIDYAEVAITRRLYRNGENEYLINKSKVRLFDILMLLAKANFGQKTYSIIGQGMVDQIINISPFERKEFFDEATGVKQYQIKRDQSVNRLRRAKENLKETNQIVSELEPRLRLLSRQVKKLEKRNEIEKELRTLQRQYYSSVCGRLKREQKEKEDKFNIEDAVRQELESDLSQVQTKLADAAKEESRKDIFNNLQKDFTKIVGEKNEYLKEMAIIKGKMNLEYMKAGKQNLSWLEDRKEEIARRLGEINESLNNIHLRIENKKQLKDKSEEAILNLQNELAVLQNNLATAEQHLANIKKGKASFALPSINAVMRQKSFIKGIHGAVGELGKTDQMYETVLSVSAGAKLSGIVVESDETAVRCINFLKENRLSPVAFFPLNKLKVPNFDYDRAILSENGAIGYAVDLVSFDSKYRKVFQLIFGSTIVIDNIENAKNIGIGRERMATIDGDLMEKNGIMKGGFRNHQQFSWKNDQSSASETEKLKEIALLQSKIQEKIKHKEYVVDELNEYKVAVQVDETKCKGLENDKEQLAKEQQKIAEDIKENQIAFDDEDRYLKNLTIKKDEVELKIDKVDKSITDIRKRLDAFNIDEENKKMEFFRIQRDMQQIQEKLNESVRLVNEIKISLARLEAKKEDLEKEVEQEMEKSVDLDSLQEKEAVNVDQLWFEIGKLKQNLEFVGGIDPEVMTEHKEVEERYNFLSEQVADLGKAIADLEKIVRDLDAIIESQFTESFQKINKLFEQYFQKIFNGGKAKLTLIQREPSEKPFDEPNEADRLGSLPIANEANYLIEPNEIGIDIYVSPPNKKLSVINALSGGEKTMTSLALLCAIIENNPSPFVVMDEVDAALDEVNSERFAHILQELSGKSQFVVITHNRVIMHVADVLYGVTMGADGASRTLSLRLKEAEKDRKIAEEYV